MEFASALKDIEKIIIAFITGVLGPVLLLLLKQYFTRKEKKPDKVTEAALFSSVVNHVLLELRVKYNADRVYITQFHNGGNYYPTGKSIQKFSMFYEIVSNKTYSIQDKFQNIPVSLFGVSIGKLSEDQVICIPNVLEDEELGIKHISSSNGVKSMYLFSLRNIEGQFIGTLGMEFTQRVTWLNEELTDEIRIKAAQLGATLMSHLTK